MSKRQRRKGNAAQPAPVAARSAAEAPVLRLPDWRLIAALIVLTFAAYGPVFQAGFIWDDDLYVSENKTLYDLDGLYRIWFDRHANPQYYPLVHTVFWVEYHLWGLQPPGYHLVNVALHAGNAVLLLLVLRRLNVPGAFWAAAFFAVHPVISRTFSPRFSTCAVFGR
jgi:protein O-mannosyl-transferase